MTDDRTQIAPPNIRALLDTQPTPVVQQPFVENVRVHRPSAVVEFDRPMSDADVAEFKRHFRRPHQKFWDAQMRDLQRFLALVVCLGLLWWLLSASGITEGAPPAPAPEAAPVPAAPAGGDTVWLTRGSSGEQVRAVQSFLAGHGWTLDVDGHYGPVTEAVVTRVQSMSGLLADGIVGPITWDAFDLDGPPTAVRSGEQVQVSEPPAPAPTIGTAGNCESWFGLTRKYGLPDWFVTSVGWRESRCDPNAYNGNRSTGDHSFGMFQVNRLGSLGGWFDSAGYSESYMSTAEGGIHAAGALFAACGSGPWDKAAGYTCNGSGRLPQRSAWP